MKNECFKKEEDGELKFERLKLVVLIFLKRKRARGVNGCDLVGRRQDESRNLMDLFNEEVATVVVKKSEERVKRGEGRVKKVKMLIRSLQFGLLVMAMMTVMVGLAMILSSSLKFKMLWFSSSLVDNDSLVVFC